MVQSLYLPVVLLAAVVGMAVGFVAWLRRDQAGARPLTLFVTAASFWAVAEGLGIAAGGLAALRFWQQVALTISVVIPIAWLATVLEYTGNEKWLTRRSLVALLVEPAAFVFLVWTNAGHHLVWTGGHREFLGAFSTYGMDLGIAFWGHQAYSYLLVAVGGGLLLRVIFRTETLYRRQSTALLLAIVVPLAGKALYLFGLTPDGLDPTAALYVFSGIVLGAAMFRSQLFRIGPAIRDMGREELISDLDDAVLIVDGENHLVEMNPAGRALLGESRADALGESLHELCPDLAEIVDDSDKTQIRMDQNGSIRYYDVQVSDLYRQYGTLSGRLVSLRDVTEQRRRAQRLDVLNRILRHNIRNELNVVRGNVDLARMETDEESVVDRLDDAVETLDSVVERSDKVNTLSRLFETDTGGTLELVTHLESELANVRREHPEATLEGDFSGRMVVTADPSVVAAFDELIRNAIEHNDDPTVTVALDRDAGDSTEIGVKVRDDGPGIEEQELAVIREGRETPLEHGSGVGLWLTNWVVERNGGTLSFENTDNGCTATVTLPRASADGDGVTEAEQVNATNGADDPAVESSRDHHPGAAIGEPPTDGGE